MAVNSCSGDGSQGQKRRAQPHLALPTRFGNPGFSFLLLSPYFLQAACFCQVISIFYLQENNFSFLVKLVFDHNHPYIKRQMGGRGDADGGVEGCFF